MSLFGNRCEDAAEAEASAPLEEDAKLSGPVRRRAAFLAALPLALLAACSGGAPSPPALPAIADQSLRRGCACVERNRCVVSDDAFESQSETRNFQCRLDDNGHATCTSETRFTPNAPWARTTLRFRRTSDRSWCWTERSGVF